jgi:hypothetical protein
VKPPIFVWEGQDAEEVPLAEFVEQAAERFETRNPSGADLLRRFVPRFLPRKRN